MVSSTSVPQQQQQYQQQQQEQQQFYQHVQQQLQQQYQQQRYQQQQEQTITVPTTTVPTTTVPTTTVPTTVPTTTTPATTAPTTTTAATTTTTPPPTTTATECFLCRRKFSQESAGRSSVAEVELQQQIAFSQKSPEQQQPIAKCCRGGASNSVWASWMDTHGVAVACGGVLLLARQYKPFSSRTSRSVGASSVPQPARCFLLLNSVTGETS
ncbi:unnamed protein product, partial [Polarella glacialis]